MTVLSTENRTKPIVDILKYFAAIVIGVGATVFFYYFGEIAGVYRALVLGIGWLISAVVLLNTTSGCQLLAFMKESRAEVRRMVWPTQQETLQATFFVVGLVVLVGTFLWLLDALLLWGIQSLSGQAH